ncbi:MAG: polysaccharide biosynthesis/export family protein [Rhodobacterales bacterium]|nr:polysaccharide biosynthesis/export family protein [Rhodobacterales bacterium]
MFRKTALMMAAILALASCSLPRGAALSSEILRQQETDTPTIDVIPVGRENVSRLAKWPATGWHGHYHWLEASRGPSAPLIRAGDKIDLVIWDSQQNSLLTNPSSKTVTMNGLVVSPSGAVFVPYLEDVVVRGMTPSNARRKIQDALSPIVPDAQVQLTLSAGQSNSVDLVSGVARPGTYPLPGRNYTILSLIAQGGGISENLRNPIVRLIRGSQTFEIRADTLFSTASKNAALRGNDKVLVQEDDRYFTALGATGSEKLFYFEKESITALEALSIIGGLSDSRADPKGVLILREYAASAVRNDDRGPNLPQVVFTIDLTTADGLFAARAFQINPRDTVLATESPITVVQTIFSLFGSALGLANRI